MCRSFCISLFVFHKLKIHQFAKCLRQEIHRDFFAYIYCDKTGDVYSVYAFKRSIKKPLMTTPAEPFKNLRYHSNLSTLAALAIE